MTDLTQALPEGDSAVSAVNSSWIVATANSNQGLRYRQRFSFTLPTGGVAEKLLVNAESGLRIKAEHLILDALDTAAPERAQVRAQGTDGLRVTLPLPRQVYSLRFANNVEPGGKKTQLFRTDGDTVAEEAVVSYRNPESVSVGVVSGVSVVVAEQQRAASTPVIDGHELEVVSPAGVTALDRDELQAMIRGAPGLPRGELGVIDGDILVRLLDGSVFKPLPPDSLRHYNLVTGPENLRVGLRLPDLGEEFFYLPLTFPVGQQVDTGDAFPEQLNDLLRRLQGQLTDAATGTAAPGVLPDPLQIELTVESDAPCRITISQFLLRYHLARHSLPAGEPKQVLKFTPGKLAAQGLSFNLPPSATLLRADVRVAGGDDGSAAAAEHLSPAGDEFSALAGQVQESGLRLDPAHGWASPIELTEPLLAGGWHLLLSALTDETQLQLEIVADRNGSPGGELLAEAAALLQEPGRPQLLYFELEKPLLTQPGTYWLTLHCRDGAALWHLEPRPGARCLPAAGNTAGGAVVEGLAAVATWRPTAGPAAAETQLPSLSLAGQPLPASRDGRDWVYDMRAVLGASTAPSDSLLTTELSIMISGPSTLTVYPPRLEFEL